MAWGWNRYPEYVPVAEKKKKAEKLVVKLRKSGKNISPVAITGNKIANSFWGRAWCTHLESYSDYESRLPRGRSYVRHGAVVDLHVTEGVVTAQVNGSSLYQVTIRISSLAKGKWQQVKQHCAGEIGSAIELLQGKLSNHVMQTVTHKTTGLFPAPDEISLSCSCPDWAGMCKHVAATLYGVGARLDAEPELLFTLRSVDHLELVRNVGIPTTPHIPQGDLEGEDLSVLFGIEMEEKALEPAKKPAARNPKKKAAATNTTKAPAKKALPKKKPGTTKGKKTLVRTEKKKG